MNRGKADCCSVIVLSLICKIPSQRQPSPRLHSLQSSEGRDEKREAYGVTVWIVNNNIVTNAECKCPGGKQPACCKHVFGLLVALEDNSRLQLYKVPTEKLQQWHQPKPTPVPIMKVKDVCTESEPSFDCAVNTMALSSMAQTTPIFSVLYGESSPSLAVDEIFYSSTSPLPVPAEDEGAVAGSIVESLSQDAILYYQEHIKMSLAEIQALEFSTMPQTYSQWHAERLKRLSASTLHRVVYRQGEFLKLAQELSKPGRDLSGIKPIQFGRLNEPSIKNVLRFKFRNHTYI